MNKIHPTTGFGFSLLFFCMIGINPVSAADPNPLLVDTISEVVVTGSAVSAPKESLPLSISILDRKSIAASGESSLLQVLGGRIPGLFVTERGVAGYGVSTGAAGQISLRGVGGSPTTGVLLMTNGNPQFMGIFGHPLADTYQASDLERVEVIRGPASILYGSNALAGVVNAITREPAGTGFSGEANMQYGSFNTKDFGVNASWAGEKLHVFASLNHEATAGHREHSAYSGWNGYAKVSYRLHPKWKMQADFGMDRFKAADPGPDTLNALVGKDMDVTRQFGSFALNHHTGPAEGRLRLYGNAGVHDITDGFHSNDHNLGLTLSETFRFFEGNRLSLGLDLAEYGGKASNGHNRLLDTAIQEKAVYALVEQRLASAFLVSAGIRRQSHSSRGGVWIPSAGLVWQPDANTSLRFSAGKGFRSPTLRELYLWNHNELLKPERTNQLELGLSQHLWQGRMQLEASVYRLSGQDMIVAGAFGKWYNTGRFLHHGLEASVDVRLNETFSFQATYSYIHMEKPAFAAPRNQLGLMGRYQKGKFDVSGNLRWIEHLNTQPLAAASPWFEDYLLLNVRAGYALYNNAHLFVRADNLLNQRYETIRYYTMPGVRIATGLNLNW